MESFVQGICKTDKTGVPLGKEKVPRDLTSAVPTLPLPHLSLQMSTVCSIQTFTSCIHRMSQSSPILTSQNFFLGNSKKEQRKLLAHTRGTKVLPHNQSVAPLWEPSTYLGQGAKSLSFPHTAVRVHTACVVCVPCQGFLWYSSWFHLIKNVPAIQCDLSLLAWPLDVVNLYSRKIPPLLVLLRISAMTSKLALF